VSYALSGGRESAALPLEVIQGYGHEPEHVRDIGLGAAVDKDIAQHARNTRSILITRDLDFAQVLAYPPAEYAGIIVMRLPDDTVASQIVALFERFLKRFDLVTRVPNHLVILEIGRVRFRPPLA
jgi:predicted nuclease of predicted toxin-antitoxin system